MLSKHPLEIPRDRKLSIQEVADALRLSIIAELDAINLYLQLARSIEDEKIKRVFEDIAREEKTHVGEFLALLEQLDPEQVEELKKGAQEVLEITGARREERINQSSSDNIEVSSIDDVVKSEVRKYIDSIRGLARKLPYVVLGRGVDAVSFERITDKYERIVTSLCEISYSFRVSQRSIDQYLSSKTPIELQDAYRGAGTIISQEEKIIIDQLTENAGAKLEISAWTEPGSSVIEIAKAVSELARKGIPRPYLLIVHPARYLKLLAVSEKTGVTDLQRIKELVDDIVVSIHIPENNAVLLSNRPEIVDLVYGGRDEVDPIGPENGFMVYRLWSSIAIRVKNPNGIVLLVSQ